jgi:DedD protein
MEEKNELNDIILNKAGSGNGSKKLLLAIAALTVILIIILVIMSSLKNNEVQKSPQAILPPEPSAPTEVINDPLFEPVEVLQEGNGSVGEQTLDQVAQKIKEESLQNVPAAPAPTITPTKTIPAITQNTPSPAILTPVSATPTPPKKVVPAVPQTTVVQPTITKKPEAKKVQLSPKVPEPKKIVQAKSVVPAKTITASTPKPIEVKTKSPVTSDNAGPTYFIQVGSFSKEPEKALVERLNASGLKYTSKKVGDTTKILVGPFQGEKATQDAMGTIRNNIEAKAFKIKG